MRTKITIEFLQSINIVEKLGMEGSKVARIEIGTSFSWIDLLMYMAGIGIILIVEKVWLKKEMKIMPGTL